MLLFVYSPKETKGVGGFLSKAMRERIKEFEDKSYAVADAEVSYILAWRPREEPQEVAVCLANLTLEK